MAVQFTRNGRRAMLWAQVEAMRRGDLLVKCEHLLLGLLHGEETGALRVLTRLRVDPADVRSAISRALAPEAAAPLVQSSQLSPEARTIVDQARRETERTGDDFVGTVHLLLAILRANNVTDGRTALVPSITRFTVAGLTYEAVSSIAQSMSEDGTAETPHGNGQGSHQAVSTASRIDTSAASNDPDRIAARPGFLNGRHLLSIDDLSTAEIRALFDLTREIKTGRTPRNGQSRTLALIFEKPSLRTRLSFAVAMTRLGGSSLYLGRDEIGLGVREEIRDVARVVSRMADAVAIRAFHDEHVREFAQNSEIPVINALTDREHPCQSLADFYTVLEHRSATAGMKMVFVGDGNNVAHSLMLLAPRLGTHFTLACPPGYEPDSAILERSYALAKQHGTRMEISHDPLGAADDADILYTDVWTSMGQEEEAAARRAVFAPFQINDEMIREAKDDVLVLHCLPAHRGEEISASAMDGPHSAVFDQAENRLHVQQALLAAVL